MNHSWWVCWGWLDPQPNNRSSVVSSPLPLQFHTHSTSRLVQHIRHMENSNGYLKIKGLRFIRSDRGDTCRFSSERQTLERLFESLYIDTRSPGQPPAWPAVASVFSNKIPVQIYSTANHFCYTQKLWKQVARGIHINSCRQPHACHLADPPFPPALTMPTERKNCALSVSSTGSDSIIQPAKKQKKLADEEEEETGSSSHNASRSVSIQEVKDEDGHKHTHTDDSHSTHKKWKSKPLRLSKEELEEKRGQ